MTEDIVEIRALVELAARLYAADALEEGLADVLTTLASIFGAAGILLFRPAGAAWATCGVAPDLEARLAALPRGQAPLVIEDLAADSRPEAVAATAAGFQTLRVVPLHGPSGEALGSAWFLFTRNTTFAPRAARALELGTRLAAGWIARASRGRSGGAVLALDRGSFEAVARQLSVGVLLAEAPTARVVFANDAVSEILGEPFAPPVGVADYGRLSAIHEDGRAYAPEEYPLVRAVTGGERVSQEVLYRRHDGVVLELRVHATPIRDARGTITQGVALFHDVSAERRAREERGSLLAMETAARREIERTRAVLDVLIEKAPVAFAFLDARLTVVRGNEELARLAGLGAAALAGRRIGDVLPALAAEVEPACERVLATGEAVRDLELRGDVPSAPGERRCWLASYYRVQVEGSAPLGVAALIRDVTDAKWTAEALKQSEERFRTAFDDAAIGVALVAPDGRVLRANAALGRILGHAKDELPGRSLFDLCHEQDAPRARDVVLALLRGETSVAELEHRWIHRNGRTISVLLTASLVRDRDGRPAHLVTQLQDTTPRRQAEERLRQTHKIEAVGRLAGGIAHDFNNTLTAVLGYADLLQTLPVDPAVKTYLHEIVRGAERAAALTKQLLAFSQRQIRQPRLVVLNQVVEDNAPLLRRVLGDDVLVETRLAPDLWATSADPSQLEQILLHLAVFARESMPGGGRFALVTENVHVTDDDAQRPGAPPPGEWVHLRAQDDGHGLDEETRDHAFEPFFRPTGPGASTGLGLATVYGIVTQSGGAVRLDSELGKGTAFRLYLPPAREGRPMTPAAPAPARRSSTAVVLVVEDEPSVRRLLSMILGEAGYEVIAAEDGVAALAAAAARKESIDLLVTDVVMPRMGGRELAQRLTRERPKLRVLYVSGYTDNALVQQGVLEAGVELLQKPFTPETLVKRVRAVLGT